MPPPSPKLFGPESAMRGSPPEDARDVPFTPPLVVHLAHFSLSRFAHQLCQPSFRGALLREPEIHNHPGEHGFRPCPLVGYRRLRARPRRARAHREMTNAGFSSVAGAPTPRGFAAQCTRARK